MKKNKYVQRVTGWESTFCPLVFACTGGAGPSALKALKQLASDLSARKEDSYADFISNISKDKSQFWFTKEFHHLHSWVKDA